MNTPDANTTSAAEHTVALMLLYQEIFIKVTQLAKWEMGKT